MIKICKEKKDISFLIKCKDAFVKLTSKEIIYIKVEGRYCNIVSNRNTLLIQYSLSEFLNYLPFNDFIKIHRNYVINIHCIKKAYLRDNSVYLDNEKVIPIGRTYKKLFCERYVIFSK